MAVASLSTLLHVTHHAYKQHWHLCSSWDSNKEGWPFTVARQMYYIEGKKENHWFRHSMSIKFKFPMNVLFLFACWAEIFLHFHKFGNISYNYSILLKLIKTATIKWPRTFSVWLSFLKLRSGNIIANHDWFAKFWCLFSAWVRTLETNSILESRDYSGT